MYQNNIYTNFANDQIFGFSNYKNDRLIALKNKLELFMELDILKLCQASLKRSKQKNISAETLRFLDSLVKVSASLVQNLYIDTLTTDSQELVRTYNDMLNKLESKDKLTLKDACLASYEYAKKIGLAAPDRENTEIVLPENIALVLLEDTPNGTEYTSKIAELFSSDLYRDRCPLIKQIDARGIAYALCEISNGIYLGATDIYNFYGERSLTLLTSAAHGRYIVAVSKFELDALKETAWLMGLSPLYIAATYNTGKIAIKTDLPTPQTVEQSLILELGNSRYPADFALSHSNYADAASAFAECVLKAAVGNGRLSDISVSEHFSFPQNMSTPQERGACLSAVLGTYRAAEELCTSLESPLAVFVNREEIALKMSAKRTADSDISDLAVSANSNLYLLSYNIDGNGNIDYESYRAMFSLIRSLIANRFILSARAFVGDIAKEINEYKNNNTLIPSAEHASTIKNTKAGILIQTTGSLPSALLLGKLEPLHSNFADDQDV